MSPNQLYGQSADDRHFDLVEGALHEATESADKGDLAGGGEAGARGNHVLFGDTAFEIALRICLGEILRISRVFDVAVERNDARIGGAECFERQPISASRRHRLLFLDRFRHLGVAGTAAMNPAGGRAGGAAVGVAVGWAIGKPRAISSCEIAATPCSFARWSSAPSTESSWSFGTGVPWWPMP